MAVSTIALQVRSEIFENGLYPAASAHFTPSSLTAIIKDLHSASTIEYKITLQQWCDEVVKKIPTLSVQDVEIYFTTYKTLVADLEALVPTPPSKSAKQPAGSKEPLDKTVDIRCFAIYMGMQLFCQSINTATESRKMMVNTPWPGLVREPGFKM
jgi:hypothetical protein